MPILPVLSRRIRALDPFVADVLLAALFGVVSLVQLIYGQVPDGYREPDALGVGFLLAATVPLAWRRRVPLTVLAWTVLVTLAAEVLAVPYGTGLGVVVALYTVASNCDRRRSVVALAAVTTLTMALLVAGMLLAPEAQVTADYFLTNLLGLGVAWALGDNQRTRRAYTAEVEARAERLERDREAATRAAADAERARIARELHDVVAHHVSVMAVQAGAARRVAETRPGAARDALAAIESSARLALTELRRLLGVLRAPEPNGPALSPQPGLGELDELLAQTRAAGLAVELTREGEARPLPAAADLSAYRIVQEALTNTRKHAGAATATVRLRWPPDWLEVRVADDGRGVVGADELGGGHGLVGMRERAALFGGELRVEPRPGGGLQVTATLPYDRNGEGA
jgi:signal transduction histidine kinase